MAEKIRLNKFISDSGVCSRREADKFIETGKVLVNGHRAVVGEMVSAKDKVMLNGQRIEAKVGDEFVFLAFNKPVGVISTTQVGVKDSIIDYIGYHERIFPIGRLDKDSQGLIFMTNNGDIVNKILRAGNKHEKEYIVKVNKNITKDFLDKMSAGVYLKELNVKTKQCRIYKVNSNTFRIVLTQGLNRQIRRMCEELGIEVARLKRTAIAGVKLGMLPQGKWRELTPQEVSHILSAAGAKSNKKEKRR